MFKGNQNFCQTCEMPSNLVALLVTLHRIDDHDDDDADDDDVTEGREIKT